ncbi:hypothetical protein BaRGS_00039907, partial [Batillaria attramentaria]
MALAALTLRSFRFDFIVGLQFLFSAVRGGHTRQDSILGILAAGITRSPILMTYLALDLENVQANPDTNVGLQYAQAFLRPLDGSCRPW